MRSVHNFPFLELTGGRYLSCQYKYLWKHWKKNLYVKRFFFINVYEPVHLPEFYIMRMNFFSTTSNRTDRKKERQRDNGWRILEKEKKDFVYLTKCSYTKKKTEYKHCVLDSQLTRRADCAIVTKIEVQLYSTFSRFYDRKGISKILSTSLTQNYKISPNFIYSRHSHCPFIHFSCIPGLLTAFKSLKYIYNVLHSKDVHFLWFLSVPWLFLLPSLSIYLHRENPEWKTSFLCWLSLRSDFFLSHSIAFILPSGARVHYIDFVHTVECPLYRISYYRHKVITCDASCVKWISLWAWSCHFFLSFPSIFTAAHSPKTMLTYSLFFSSYPRTTVRSHEGNFCIPNTAW